MSGGSYNYLCWEEHPTARQLEPMALRLEELGFADLAEMTRSYAPPEVNEMLREIWQAIEWYDSSDWGIDQVVGGVQEFYEKHGDPYAGLLPRKAVYCIANHKCRDRGHIMSSEEAAEVDEPCEPIEVLMVPAR